MFTSRHIMKNVKKTLWRVKLMSTKASSLIDVAIDDEGTALVTLQRPPVNSLNVEMLHELSKALDEIETKKCKAMILTSASPTVFSAGIDLVDMCKADVKKLNMLWSAFYDVWRKLYGSSFITTAAINGHAMGGACMLLLACEYRTMVNGKFTIGLNETPIGIVVPKFIIDSMLLTIARRQVEMMVTQGKLFSVDEALKVGLIDNTTPTKKKAIANCQKFIKSFHNISPMARAHAKKTFRGPALQSSINKQQHDKAQFISIVSEPEVQNKIKMHIRKKHNK